MWRPQVLSLSPYVHLLGGLQKVLVPLCKVSGRLDFLRHSQLYSSLLLGHWPHPTPSQVKTTCQVNTISFWAIQVLKETVGAWGHSQWPPVQFPLATSLASPRLRVGGRSGYSFLFLLSHQTHGGGVHICSKFPSPPLASPLSLPAPQNLPREYCMASFPVETEFLFCILRHNPWLQAALTAKAFCKRDHKCRCYALL